MASSSQSGQIRNSNSPSVIALSSAKAPSAATAKPRFRSRTGCWTCRRRKVKCDERGRNPETVAYGGPLSSSSGCKRCEDSGRPCHGYGAQAPSGPLITHFPPNNLNSDSLISSTPFYSFSSHAREGIGLAAPLPAPIGNMEPVPCSIPTNSIQWSQPFDPCLSGNQAINYGLRMGRNSQSSSGSPSISLGASPLEAMQQSCVQLPSVDLRRYSVPNYPTWQRSSQPRSVGNYSSGSLLENSFPIEQVTTTYDNNEVEVLPQANSPSVSARPQPLSQAGDCPVLSNDTNQKLNLLDMSSHYNHELNDGDRSSLSFYFGRPRTANGVALCYDDAQTHQSQVETYRSPAVTNPKELECIEEPHYGSPNQGPSPIAGPDITKNVWPDQQSAAFGSMSSAITNSVSSAPITLFSVSVSEPSISQTQESYNTACATDIPIFSSAHDIPYDMYAVSSTLLPTIGSTGPQTDTALGIEKCGTDSANQFAERSFHLVHMSSTCDKRFMEIMTQDPHQALHMNSYARSCPLPIYPEHENIQSPTRKDSSSSLSSSISTHEHNPASVTSLIRPQSGPTEKWTAPCLLPALENPQYDFPSILPHRSVEFQHLEAYEDDSPTSTAPSNVSGAAGGS